MGKELVSRAAHLRFGALKRCRTNKAVAQRIGISERCAGRLLEEVLHGVKGNTPPLVTVSVQPPRPEPIGLLALEAALMERLGLMEVRVVHPVRDEWAYPAIGAAAAQWLQERWQGMEEMSVGLDGGRAIRALLEALNLPFCLRHLPNLKRLHLFALQARQRERVLWGGGHPDLPDTVVMRCWGTVEGQKVVCHPFAGDEVIELLGVVFVSISAFETEDREVLKASGVTMAEVQGVVGTILSQPFDGTGRPLGGIWGSDCKPSRCNGSKRRSVTVCLFLCWCGALLALKRQPLPCAVGCSTAWSLTV
ncbi:MAG: hypothetical protein LKKZDAJK_001416 [Candidatus Fervidibacter sp.]